MTTTTAAKAVNTESRTDFAGELMDEKIPKATPVFRTYVMLKKPSITEHRFAQVESLLDEHFSPAVQKKGRRNQQEIRKPSLAISMTCSYE